MSHPHETRQYGEGVTDSCNEWHLELRKQYIHQGTFTQFQGLPPILWTKNPNLQAHKSTFSKEKSNIYLAYKDKNKFRLSTKQTDTKGGIEECSYLHDHPAPLQQMDSYSEDSF